MRHISTIFEQLNQQLNFGDNVTLELCQLKRWRCPFSFPAGLEMNKK